MSTPLRMLSNENWVLSNPNGNVTVTTTPSRVPTVNAPTLVTTGVIAAGDGVLKAGDGGMECEPHLLIVPVGSSSTAAGGNSFTMNVIGWRKTKFNVIGQQGTWIPTLLGSYSISLGTVSVGVGTNQDLGTTTTTYFGSTIVCGLGPTLTSNASNSADWLVINPASVTSIGLIKQPMFGFRYVELIFANGTSSGANALIARG